MNKPKMIFLKFLFIHIFPILAAALIWSEPGFEKKASPPGKPNILFILPDDLGWADVGYHGSDIKTPNIDRLARSGKILSQHYVMPTCTPTRVSLMTGKYPSRYGVLAPAYGEVIDLGDPTLASLLAENGYYTAIAGKWHMGSPPYTPLKYGFQSSYGYFDGQIDPYTHEYKTETELTERRSWHRNDEYLDESGSHVTDLLTAEAIRIIEEDRDQPFFLYVTHHVPHSPLSEPEKYHKLYKDDVLMHPSRRLFAAAVSHLDESIGQIIDALERTGKRENTLIVFVSDNGAQQSWQSKTEYEGRYADDPHLVLGNNYPLRGWKGSLYEGGIRVPGFINWPGHLEPGIVDFPIHVSDWLPTLCKLTGFENGIPQDVDGKDIWQNIVIEGKEQVKASPMYWKIRGTHAVRQGDWKLLLHGENKIELYNLKEDFRESHNLSEGHPEKVEEMMLLLEEFKKDDR
ncbi:arylsulfatase B [Cyclobacterium plantarum]|uniref:arylsulfatase B n=1 Tax=Cyclobacterium plantarum TaxID=2716263 RepID=UPI003F6F1C24